MIARIAVLSIAVFGAVKATLPQWGQCGGIGYTGDTVCPPGYVCTVQNPWYYQCLYSESSSTTSSSTTISSSTSIITSVYTDDPVYTPISSSSSSKSSSTTASKTCPIAVARATGTPVVAITTGTPVYGYYLQRDSSTQDGILTPTPFSAPLHFSSTTWWNVWDDTANCTAEYVFNVLPNASNSTLSYHPLKLLKNMQLTYNWLPDITKPLQTISNSSTIVMLYGPSSTFLVCQRTDGAWQVYLSTGTDQPAGQTCVFTQLKAGELV